MKNRFAAWLARPEVVTATLITIFGLLSTFIMPLLAVPDENQHFQVEYTVFSSLKKPPSEIIKNESLILESVRNHTHSKLYTQAINAEHDGFSINTNAKAFGNTNVSFLDIMRLPQAIGIAVARLIYPSIGAMVILGRIANLTIYMMGIYFIIKNVRFGKWAFAFIASLPMMIQQAASLSYDSTNLVIVFAWFAFIINLWVQKTSINKRTVALGAILSILLLFSKQNNLLLFALLLATPEKKILALKPIKYLRKSRFWKPSLILATVTSILFSIVAAYVIGISLLSGHNLYPTRLAAVLVNTFVAGDLGLIDISVKGVVGVFSNFYYGLPMWAVVIAFCVLTLILLSQEIKGLTKRMAVVCGLLFLGSILLIAVGMYYQWAMRPERLGPNAMVADGIQGRYFTPLLILLLPVISYARKYFKVVVSNDYVIPILSMGTSTFLLVLYLFQTWDYFWR